MTTLQSILVTNMENMIEALRNEKRQSSNVAERNTIDLIIDCLNDLITLYKNTPEL